MTVLDYCAANVLDIEFGRFCNGSRSLFRVLADLPKLNRIIQYHDSTCSLLLTHNNKLK